MELSTSAVLAVCMRWIHITSVVTLIGGFIYARFGLTPVLATLGESEAGRLGRRVVESFRPLLYTALVTTFGSGLYNYLNKSSYPPHYHMWIGIKFLFVLHIFAVAILYTLPNASEAKRSRWLTGMVLSGWIVIAISAYLRWISLR
jgi:ribose/xylose/arabinose/galactoside ABC-type transport system permease subunit